jgi:hypothetical protein
LGAVTSTLLDAASVERNISTVMEIENNISPRGENESQSGVHTLLLF